MFASEPLRDPFVSVAAETCPATSASAPTVVNITVFMFFPN
ncbi:hypothetical protein RGUI_0756 [Rhodovulum sp. P5]|nr:hypothetical protein RGUI_0756 [Rhodovulum sp. P5]